ncbi:hypothetical protein [Streptomyces sp. NPDC051665]|uniref:hypothetical protein n=1 Tax=Streptomyces sp. NPDC051665 TaxID=3154647 RepID=UPI00343C961A
MVRGAEQGANVRGAHTGRRAWREGPSDEGGCLGGTVPAVCGETVRAVVDIDPADRVEYAPGEVAQRDLRFPSTPIPVGAGQERILPVLAMPIGHSHYIGAVMHIATAGPHSGRRASDA